MFPFLEISVNAPLHFHLLFYPNFFHNTMIILKWKALVIFYPYQFKRIRKSRTSIKIIIWIISIFFLFLKCVERLVTPFIVSYINMFKYTYCLRSIWLQHEIQHLYPMFAYTPDCFFISVIHPLRLFNSCISWILFLFMLSSLYLWQSRRRR